MNTLTTIQRKQRQQRYDQEGKARKIMSSYNAPRTTLEYHSVLIKRNQDQAKMAEELLKDSGLHLLCE